MILASVKRFEALVHKLVVYFRSLGAPTLFRKGDDVAKDLIAGIVELLFVSTAAQKDLTHERFLWRPDVTSGACS